jgi:hypothetical protein
MPEQPAGSHRPTPWTRPLRYVIVSWYGLGALWSLSLPVWLIGPLALTFYSVSTMGLPGPIPP